MYQTPYSNPTIPLIDNPVNLDRHIQNIQIVFSDELPWLEKSFGRAWVGERKVDNKSYKYPEVYIGNGEYLDVLPNDHLKAQSFIQVRGQRGRALEYSALHDNKFQYTLEIIFWFNLNIVNPAKTYRYNEELKTEVLNVIKNRLSLLQVLNIYEAPEDVYAGYSINHLDRQTFKHPYGGFKIECDLTFYQDCP